MTEKHHSLDRPVREQIEYYQARAGEYDEWLLRQGRYDRGPVLNRQWFHEVQDVVAALAEFHPEGKVLELAAGTGLWTRRLADFASSITVVDSSDEMLARNRDRMREFPVQYIHSDIFAWRPQARYDVVFFSFWLSHVPPHHFEGFWRLVRSCLASDGRVFFLDSLYDATSTAIDHKLASPEVGSVKRRLNDGREFTIIKMFYEPRELAESLSCLKWNVTVRRTTRYFLYGSGTRAPWPPPADIKRV